MVHTSAVTQKELLPCAIPGRITDIHQTRKTSRGLKGISTNPEQVAVWIESIGVCSHLAMVMDGMYSSNARPASETTNVKHKEEGSKRRELDRDDRLRILTELRKHSHPLTHPSDSLYNIVNGQVVSETEVNVQDAVAIGQDMRTSFAVTTRRLPPPNKENCQDNASPEAWREDQGENCVRPGSRFRTPRDCWAQQERRFGRRFPA